MLDPGSLGEIIRHRIPEQVGVLLFSLILVLLVLWALFGALSTWRQKIDPKLRIVAYYRSGSASGALTTSSPR